MILWSSLVFESIYYLFFLLNWLVDLRNSFSIYYHCIIIVVVIQDIYFSISWLCCCCVSAVFFVYMVILKHHLFLSTAVPKTGHSLLPRLYGFSALSWWLLVYVNVYFVNHLVTLLYLLSISTWISVCYFIIINLFSCNRTSFS